MSRSRLLAAALVLLGVALFAGPLALGAGAVLVVAGIALGLGLAVLGAAMIASARARRLGYEAYDRGSALGLLSLAVVSGAVDVAPRRRFARALRSRTASALAERYGDTRATYLAIAELARRHAGEATVPEGSGDLPRIYLELLPSLPAGVTIQIHDVYLPYLYSPAVMSDLWDWQETALLAALMTDNPRLEVLCCQSALHHALPERLRALLPDYEPRPLEAGIDTGAAGHFPASIWLRTR